MEKKTVQIHIRISEDMRDEFRKIADNNSQNTSALIRKWITEYIKENKIIE